MTQRELDIRRRRLTAVFVLVGAAFWAYGLVADLGWMAPGALPPVAKASKTDKRVARAAHTMSGSALLGFTPARGTSAARRLADKRLPLFCGGAKPYVALTFDDGPTPLTRRLTKLLRESGVSATFFVLGSRLSEDKSSVKDMLSVGELGNHSWSHSAFNQLSSKEIKREVTDTGNLIRTEQGRGTSLVRPPYGARDDRVNKVLSKMHMAENLWSADTEDALGADWRRVADYAVSGFGPGAIVLMHDGKETTLTALRKKILPAARRGKLQFVTLSELLTVNPPSEAQLAAGPQGCALAGKRNVSGLFFKPSEQLNYQP